MFSVGDKNNLVGPVFADYDFAGDVLSFERILD